MYGIVLSTTSGFYGNFVFILMPWPFDLWWPSVLTYDNILCLIIWRVQLHIIWYVVCENAVIIIKYMSLYVTPPP